MRAGRELHLWGWAHRTEFRWYCPVELLTWTAMQQGMAAGCTTLDMAGGGDAKLKFGARSDTTLCEWRWSRYAWLARARDLAERAYRWQQSARGRRTRKRPKAERAAATNAAAHAAPRMADSLARTPDARAFIADELTAHES
jgi:hypothetical protein